MSRKNVDLFECQIFQIFGSNNIIVIDKSTPENGIVIVNLNDKIQKIIGFPKNNNSYETWNLKCIGFMIADILFLRYNGFMYVFDTKKGVWKQFSMIFDEFDWWQIAVQTIF